MFGRNRTDVLKENGAAAAALAAELAADKTFRNKLLDAAGHGVSAQRRARRRLGALGAASRLVADEQLRAEVVQMTRDLQAAWGRVEKQRSHRLRTTLLLLGGAGGVAAAAAPPTRTWLVDHVGGLAGGPRPRTINATVEVDVPVETAYNQWTQFEEFPRFMRGVEEVRQLDDTRLHWVAVVGGKRAEWEAKILEQHPDQQISWISDDGKKTRGTVTFEPLGPSHTLVRLSMGYQAAGGREAIGSALGLDRRRVKGDLARFKQLIEAVGTETGAWRGDISAGSTQPAETATNA